LFAHLTIVHFDVSFYKCGENNCFRTFETKNSFRKHLQKCHNFPLEYKSSVKCNQNVSSCNENINSNLILSHTDIQTDLQTDVRDDAFILPDQFSLSLQRSAEIFVSKLYSNPRFPRNLIQKVIMDVSSMMGDEYLSILKQNVIHIIKGGHCTQNEIEGLEVMFKALENPFKDFRSEYFCFKHFTNSGDYIAPIL